MSFRPGCAYWSPSFKDNILIVERRLDSDTYLVKFCKETHLFEIRRQTLVDLSFEPIDYPAHAAIAEEDLWD